MVKLTITIGPAPGGVGVNVRQDGAPDNHVEAFYLGGLRHGITSALKTAVVALEAAGIGKQNLASGEAARVRGEERNGVPGSPGAN